MKTLVLPSLLGADMGCLRAEVRRAQEAGADAIHIDIMDGHFVPNVSLGPAIVEMVRRAVSLPLSVHLMMTRPDQYVNTFNDAGASSLLIHIEAECNVPQCLIRIRELGVAPGITLNPETPAELVFPVMGMIDEVLCMTVHPGYGGQAFMPEVLPKVRALRAHADDQGLKNLTLMVDGGINRDTAATCAAHGANAFVSGTFLFEAKDMAEEVSLLRNKVAEQ